MFRFPFAALAASGCFAIHPSRGGGQIRDAAPPRAPLVEDVAVTAGYELEVAATGLDFPTGIAFDDQGRIHVVEAGYAYGEVFATPRLVRIEDDGTRTEIARGANGPWTGVVWHDGAFLVAEGGVEAGGRLVRIAPDGTRTVLVDGLPSFGDHHTNGPAVGPDGWVYLGQGTATNAGVVGPDNFEFGWLSRHPDFHDVPCADLVLTGQNFRSKDPLRGGRTETGPFKPFGTPSEPGEVVRGETKCSGAILRVRPDGSDLQLYAWGFRNPFGLAFSPDGQLYATDNAYDVRGSRPVFGAGDWMWKVEAGRWYGWPDHADGEPLGAHRWKSPGHPKPKQLLAEAPQAPPEPVAVFGVHSSADGFDFSRNPAFGYVGQAFVALFGDQAHAVGKVEAPVGFEVVRVEPDTGVVHSFLTNRGSSTGPASWHGTGGLERPVAVRFDLAGTSLYVVDFGQLEMDGDQSKPALGTGTLWRVRAAGDRPAMVSR